MAQTRGTYNPGIGPGRDHYNERGSSGLTVSPYVNLGVNSNGVSNYQTLVRPMIDQREKSRFQTDQLQPSRPPARLARASREQSNPMAEESSPRSPSSVRFMHFSHFYGGMR